MYVCVCGAVLQEAHTAALKIQDEFEDGGQDETKKRSRLNRLQPAVAKVQHTAAHMYITQT